ncbi:MAG TPA: DUF6084 family protein [Verrucomicrobiae bacterium]|nr:DUF6084 family protein [Verrucomicrobiae bacterium]
MPDLLFKIEDVKAMSDSATPVLVFSLRVENTLKDEDVRSVSLNCQLHIHPARRRYEAAEQSALADLFGERERWGKTLRRLYWTGVTVTVPAFCANTVVDVRVPCTFDFNIAATKYCAALEQGDIPVVWVFSGMVFYLANGALQMAPVSWSREAEFRIAAAVWKEMMALYYPNSAWLSLRKDVFERLRRYKARHGLLTWEQAMEHVLAAAGDTAETRVQ